jgi:predicted extracellular nuclease
MEEPAANWDSDDSTSEGIFVFTSSSPAVNVGDDVVVTGSPQEFRPGGSGGLTNLTTTEIGSPSVVVLSSGNPLPAPVIIGSGGRIPPTAVIEDDATGDVETSGVFDPANDGIDSYESLEGMLVQVNDAVATGPWHDFGSNREIPVVGDNGANASVRTNRGGVVIQSNDFNPERIILNDLIAGGPTLPPVNVSDSFPGATLGVMDYSFGNFKLEVTQLPTMVSGGLAQEATTPARTNQLALATFNVENLAPTDPQSKFDTLAELIVNHLQSPDVIAIEEIQDNNGVTDDGTVDASTTWSKLITAIQAAGGPTYDYRQIDPVNDQDGGAPGGNIRQGFLFRTDRGLSFIDRPGAGSTTANAVVGSGPGTQLLYSPGRIDPTNTAFDDSRKPLAAEFMFNGRHLFVIANHFNSKGGDNPLFGHFQPPTFSSEVQRLQQAQVEHDFVQSIVTADSNADVIVLGDLNDFQFSNPIKTLTGENVSNVILDDLINTLPLAERYSYVFDGNSEVLDHSLLSDNLFGTPFEYDVVHVNSEFAVQASDHEPQVVRLLSYNFAGFFQPVDNLPTVNTVKAGQAVPIKFSLNGDQGLNIFAAGYPKSEMIACNSTAPVDGIEETVTAGSSGLSYNATTDQYTYVWKTNKAWANSCRQLVVKLNDGTFHRANFKFK